MMVTTNNGKFQKKENKTYGSNYDFSDIVETQENAKQALGHLRPKMRKSIIDSGFRTL